MLSFHGSRVCGNIDSVLCARISRRGHRTRHIIRMIRKKIMRTNHISFHVMHGRIIAIISSRRIIRIIGRDCIIVRDCTNEIQIRECFLSVGVVSV